MITHDIFISYAREDIDFAKTLAGNLEKDGLSVWWDKSIPAGKTFDEVIEEAITTAKCVVVLWSESSTQSNWVRLEAEEGRNRNILVPIFIQDVSIPFAFKNIQAANLIGWEGDTKNPDYIQLLGDIRTVLATQPEIGATDTLHVPEDRAVSSSGSGEHPHWINKKNILIAAVAVVLIISSIFIVRSQKEPVVVSEDPTTLPVPMIKPIIKDSTKQEIRGLLENRIRERQDSRAQENSTRKIRVTVLKLTCEVSDDEGPGNDADMDRFRFSLTASQNGCSDGQNKTMVSQQIIYEYKGAEKTVSKGSIWPVDVSKDFYFNNELCDINALQIRIDAYAREADESSAHEEAKNALDLKGPTMFNTHHLKLISEDFTYDAEIRVEKVDW